MTRLTTTRARVRELADTLSAKGIEPTSTLILARLGKGSPNTVVDELRRWRADKGLAAPNTRTTSPAGVPDNANAGDQAVGEHVAALRQSLALLTPFADSIVRSTGDLGRLTSQIAELNAAVQRLDGIRLLALKQIDEARGLARYWEEEARRLREESTGREQAYRLGMYAARSESDTLRGQVEELRRMVATLQPGRDPQQPPPQGQVATLQLGSGDGLTENRRVATLQLDGPATGSGDSLGHGVATLQPHSHAGQTTERGAGRADTLASRPYPLAPLKPRSYDPDGPDE
jgi:hypothetical protein